ncbi:MAG: response regulator [Deltaproteobacteria bacterium]|nr:response regulator [Deltaproteobacteria bacterium]
MAARALKQGGRTRRPVIKILLVDDDPLICLLGRELLESLGYRVEVARGGSEALQCYQENGPADLVILDYHLPGENGSQVLARLKALDPQARVLLATGFLAPWEMGRLKEQGAVGLIYKPFRVQDLETQIQKVLADRTGG